MPTVACPACGKSVTLPDPPTAAAYSCPHCRNPVPSPAPPGAARRTPASKPEAFDFDGESDGDEPDEPASRPRQGSRRPPTNPLGDFLTFRWMITPLVIQIVFWLGVIGCIGFGGRTVVESFDAGGAGQKKPSVPLLAMGLVIATVGPLMVRIYCELLIIFFKIHDELKEANDRTRYRR